MCTAIHGNCMHTKLFLTCLTVLVPFHKSGHKCLTEVVPYCKSGHTYWLNELINLYNDI